MTEASEPPAPDEPPRILYQSGEYGLPKGESTTPRFLGPLLSAGDGCLRYHRERFHRPSTYPLYHVYGMAVGTVLIAPQRSQGSAHVSIRPGRVVASPHRERKGATLFSVFKHLPGPTGAVGIDRYDRRRYAAALTPVADDLATGWRARFGFCLLKPYGMTENGFDRVPGFVDDPQRNRINSG